MLKVIAGLFVVGSAYGSIAFLTSLSSGAFNVPHGTAMATTAAVLFGGTLAAAVWSMRGTPKAIAALQLVLLPQLIWVEATSFSFHFMAGPYFFVDVHGATSSPLVGIGGAFELLAGTGSRGAAVNLAALAALAALRLLRRPQGPDRGPVDATTPWAGGF